MFSCIGSCQSQDSILYKWYHVNILTLQETNKEEHLPFTTRLERSEPRTICVQSYCEIVGRKPWDDTCEDLWYKPVNRYVEKSKACKYLFKVLLGILIIQFFTKCKCYCENRYSVVRSGICIIQKGVQVIQSTRECQIKSCHKPLCIYYQWPKARNGYANSFLPPYSSVLRFAFHLSLFQLPDV